MKFDDVLTKIPLKRFRDPAPVVTVLPLAGVIGKMGLMRGGLTLTGLAAQIEAAFKPRNLKAVALALNSPGGSPVQSSLIAKRIRDLSEEKEIPVIAFAEDVAASGGYWLACAADEIYADMSSIIGSIGVISAGFGLDEWIQSHGVSRRVYTAGERKSILDPFKPENAEDVEKLDGLLKELHQNFQDFVRSRRGERLKGDDRALFSGEFWTGRTALDLGLIDGLGDLRGVMRERFGDRVKLRRVGGRESWIKRKLGLGQLTDPDAWAGAVFSAIEERALWQRYGL
ncbi:MAG: S49 family peptidase [Alphaproteobacteria bacterium]|nr:S49 family peptidase [Alphaproteobacteria bacterium]